MSTLLIAPALDEVFGPGWTRKHYSVTGDAWPAAMRVFVHVSTLRALKTIDRRGNRWWIHVSISRAAVMPTYADLSMAKHDLIGPGRKAIMVLPSQREHVNIHPNTLHLFAALDGDDGLPDFRNEDGML